MPKDAALDRKQEHGELLQNPGFSCPPGSGLGSLPACSLPITHLNHPAPKARTVCLQSPRRGITLKKLITHLKTKSGCSSAHQG